ncbi:MAG: hypothetical protein JNL98_02745 [Bryobacterales bacterium]|nr:hypothetical protein [Bryobacterales bacterium]
MARFLYALAVPNAGNVKRAARPGDHHSGAGAIERGWLVGIGVGLVCVAIAAMAYARSQRRRIQSATVEIEGLSIDSLNAANLRRGMNRSLTIQTAEQFARIEGKDLEMTWRYAGYCKAERETALPFSIDSEEGVPFSQLNCYAYDLKQDPERKSRIEPVLVGPESISKKITVPFLEPLKADQPFDIELHCRLTSSCKLGLHYYTSTLSFDQETVDTSTVQLTFVGRKPEWVRVYECDDSGRPQLVKTLRPEREDENEVMYRDVAREVGGQSARIYLFKRAEK